MTRGGRDGASPPAPGRILGPPPPLLYRLFLFVFSTNTHTWVLQWDENETHNSFHHPPPNRGETKKMLVMAPCCCSNPEKQSYLSATEAEQLSARVSGKKKKKGQMWPHPPAQPLAGNGVGGVGGLQFENKTIRWFQAVAVESRRGRLHLL